MEIEKIIENKIREYETGRDYQPLQVEFEVSTPIFLAHPWMSFDGLIAHLCLRDALGDLYYNLPSKIPLNINEMLQIPIKKYHDFYKASVSIFEKDDLFIDTIYKKFDDKNITHLKKRRRRWKVNRASGHYREYMIKMPYKPAQTVKFYVDGDKKELKRLTKHVMFIGKKPSIGGGMVKKKKIKKIKEDKSLIWDGQAMRPIPIKHVQKPVKVWALAYKPPYWDKRNVELCVPPMTPCKLKR